jgi:hypothetical protein
MQTVQITAAQMTALETAGIFEMADDDELALVEAISGGHIVATEHTARLICDLSNNADELARELAGEQATWARTDARVLANLYGKMLRVA